MAKPLVVHSEDNVRVPFLRGILTRSLQEAGLTFDEAYQVASDVREELRHESEITTAALRERVLQHLEAFDQGVYQRYLAHPAMPPPILVQDEDGHVSRFSRGHHRHALSVCGVTPAQAGRVVDLVLERLTSTGVSELRANDLGLLTYEVLLEEIGEEAAHRYAVWEEYTHGDVPLLLLLGGATGTGKSTIAAQLSNRLGIVRSQSTDMLREVMRMMIPERLLPVLHTSSFLAWQAMPHHAPAGGAEDVLPDGYLAQVELLSVACEAVLQRALKERVSLIVEGVHVHPALLSRVPLGSDAIVVPITLGVLKPKRLKQQIKGRSRQAPGRRAKRYLENFDAIWQLQEFLLAESDRNGIPIVTNEEIEDSVEQIISIVMAEFSKHFAGKPAKVFR